MTLEQAVAAALEGDVEPAGRRRFATDLAGAGIELAGDEVRHDVLHDPPEGHVAVHEVVEVVECLGRGPGRLGVRQVLAAGEGKAGPGPLVTMFASGLQAVPVTIVPGTLDEAAIDAIA